MTFNSATIRDDEVVEAQRAYRVEIGAYDGLIDTTLTRDGLEYEEAHALARSASREHEPAMGRVFREGEQRAVALFRNGVLIYDKSGACEI